MFSACTPHLSNCYPCGARSFSFFSDEHNWAVVIWYKPKIEFFFKSHAHCIARLVLDFTNQFGAMREKLVSSQRARSSYRRCVIRIMLGDRAHKWARAFHFLPRRLFMRALRRRRSSNLNATYKNTVNPIV